LYSFYNGRNRESDANRSSKVHMLNYYA